MKNVIINDHTCHKKYYTSYISSSSGASAPWWKKFPWIITKEHVLSFILIPSFKPRYMSRFILIHFFLKKNISLWVLKIRATITWGRGCRLGWGWDRSYYPGIITITNHSIIQKSKNWAIEYLFFFTQKGYLCYFMWNL